MSSFAYPLAELLDLVNFSSRNSLTNGKGFSAASPRRLITTSSNMSSLSRFGIHHVYCPMCSTGIVILTYDWIMKAARNAVSRWRTRYNVSEIKDRMYSRYPHTERNSNAAAPGVCRPSPFGDTRKTGVGGDRRPSPNSRWRNERSNEQDRGKTRPEDPRRSSRDRSSPGRDGRHEQPAAPGICHDWQKGQCRRGSDCRFSHHEEKPKSPRDDDGPIYPAYCREWLNSGKCTRSKRTCKHEKPPSDLAPLPRKPGAPATEQGGDPSNPYPDGRIDSPAPGVDETRVSKRGGPLPTGLVGNAARARRPKAVAMAWRVRFPMDYLGAPLLLMHKSGLEPITMCA